MRLYWIHVACLPILTIAPLALGERKIKFIGASEVILKNMSKISLTKHNKAQQALKRGSHSWMYFTKSDIP